MSTGYNSWHQSAGIFDGSKMFIYLFAGPVVMICLLLFNFFLPPVAILSESELWDKVKVIVLIDTLPLAPVS